MSNKLVRVKRKKILEQHQGEKEGKKVLYFVLGATLVLILLLYILYA